MRISIILPNFNHAAFITQALESILAQTYQDWQLCVVDDGSTDDSWAIIERYRGRDARIVAERAPHNRGVNATLRRLLELCTGELLCPLAADDYLTNSRFFELGVAALQRFPQATLAYASAAIVDANDGRKLGDMGSYIPSRRASGVVRYSDAGASVQFIPPQEALTRFVSHHMFIPGCSVILRRALMAEVGGYDEALGPQSDYFLNHALAALHGAVFIDAPVAVARVSEKTYTGSASDEDHFRRHALVEKKLRALALPYQADERLFAQFRTAAISSRLVEAYQRQLFDNVRGSCDSIPSDALQMFPQEPAAFVSSLKMDCARLETTLNRQIEEARAIFNEVAGPIALLPPVSQSRPRPWLKPVAEIFLTLGKAVGKAFSDFGHWLWEF
jgi:glycosyltransferase involved in cell wall biosynthesis